MNDSGQMQQSDLSVDVLLRAASLDDTTRSEGVSTGTRYALGTYLKLMHTRVIDVQLLTNC